MPSNIIQINGSEKLTWIIPDSKMEDIIKKLDECGDKERPSEKIIVPQELIDHNRSV